MVALAFCGLTRRLGDGTVVPDLAADWEVSADARTYVFRLRPDAFWHDGVPVTADDAVFTFGLLRSDGSPAREPLARYWRDVIADSPGTGLLRLSLPEPRIGFIEQAGIGLLPAHILGKVELEKFAENRFGAMPIGCGPYRVLSTSADKVVLGANQAFHGAKPFLSTIELRLYDNAEAVSARLADGGLTAARDFRLPTQTAATDRRDAFTQTVVSRPTVLLVNPANPVLADVAVRRAISLVLDRGLVADAALPGGSRPTSSMIPVGSWLAGSATTMGRDPQSAARILDAAGWRTPSAGGARQRSGQSLEFVLLTNDAPEHVRAASEVSRQLLEIGVRAEVQTAGWSGVIQDFVATRRFQAVLLTLDVPTVEPDLYTLLHSSQANDGLNLAGWSSATGDEQLERLRSEPRAAARLGAWETTSKWLDQETPLIPLYSPTTTTVIDRRIKGVTAGLALRPADRFATIAQWFELTRRVPQN